MRGLRSNGLAFTPEQIQSQLALLARERQQLRENGGTRESLEQNRLAIGRCQYELSHALIRRHLAFTAQRAA